MAKGASSKSGAPRAGGAESKHERGPPRRALFWSACVATYLLALWQLSPSLSNPPSSLDDLTHLSDLVDSPLARVWSHDPFGHFRPLSNGLFWLIANDAMRLGVWRAVCLGVLLASVALLHWMVATSTRSPWFGWAVATLWVLHPVTATVACWLSANSSLLCVFGLLVFGASAHVAASEAGGRRGWFWLALFALSLALLCHELAVVAPVLYARLPQRAGARLP